MTVPVDNPIKRIQLPVTDGTYITYNQAHNISTCHNLIPELDPTGKSKDGFLFPAPQLDEYATFNEVNYPRAALFDYTDPATKTLWAVIGKTLEEIPMTGGAATPYTLTNFQVGTGVETPVLMKFNQPGDQIFILETSTGVAYVFDKGTSTATQVTDADFPANCSSLAQLDGYFIVASEGSNQFFISDLLDGLNWTATNFATAESSSDVIMALDATENYLWIFGSRTIEVWQNTGNFDFPFEPIPNATLPVGILGPFCHTKVHGDYYVLGRDSSGIGLFQFNGFNYQKIFNNYADRKLRDIDLDNSIQHQNAQIIKDNLFLFSYTQGGHTYVWINVPITLDVNGAGFTLVYDVTTQRWHTRDFIPSTFIEPALDKILYGKLDIRKIHFIEDIRLGPEGTLPSGFGDTRTYTFITRYLNELRNNVIVHSIELDIQQPLLTNSAGVNETTISLETSRDGGHTWSTPRDITIPSITPMTIKQRIRWHRAGKGRDLLFRFTITDDVGSVSWPVIMGVYIDIQSTLW